jgi:hypothetical protein
MSHFILYTPHEKKKKYLDNYNPVPNLEGVQQVNPRCLKSYFSHVHPYRPGLTMKARQLEVAYEEGSLHAEMDVARLTSAKYQRGGRQEAGGYDNLLSIHL